MAIATLTVDIEAKLSRLQEGMDQAARITQRAAQDVESRWTAAGTALKAALAPLAAAFSVSTISAFIAQNARAVDSLNDISDVTGATVENISALQDVARRTGTDIATVETSLIKLNMALNNAKPGSDVEKALAAIGLTAKELKAQDPAEALRQVAVALGQFADDGNKARLVQELFDKSLREVAPLLKDLASQGKLNATVTKEQAEQAERFVHALGKFDAAATQARQSMAVKILPSLTEMIQRLNDATASWGAFNLALARANPLASVPQNAVTGLQKYRDELARLQSIIDREEGAGEGVSRRMVLDANAAREALPRIRELVRSYELLLGLTDRAGGGRGMVNPTRVLPDIGGGGDDKGRADALKRLNDARALMNKQQLQFIDDQRAAEDERERAAIEGADKVADAEKRKWAEASKAWVLYAEQVLGLDQPVVEQTKRQIEEVSEFAREARRNLQDSVADTALAGLEGRFEEIDDLWRNLLRRMLAEWVASGFNELMLGKSAGGGVLGGLLGMFGLPAFASGTDYVPRDMVAVVHQGERIVPAQQNRGGGWGSARMGDINIRVDGTADAAKTTQQMYGIVRQAQIEQTKQLKALGVL